METEGFGDRIRKCVVIHGDDDDDDDEENILHAFFTVYGAA